MKLTQLIRNSGTDISVPLVEAEISSVCYDSRRAKEGALFVCLRGTLTDGHRYARAAYEKGCRCFVCESDPGDLPEDSVIMFSSDTRKALGMLAAEFFGHPERRLRLVGITGTKGKTTTALMIKSILDASGRSAGYIGSNGVDFCGFHFDTVNTTPEGCDIYEYFARMVACGVDTAVLEVSSQALYMNRIQGLTFDICVFTNLSRDHIGGSEHPNMEHYKECKKKLFSEHCSGFALVNADDPLSGEFSRSASSADNEVRSFSISKKADYRASEIEFIRDENGLGSSFVLNFGGKKIKMKQHFPGDFSVSNAVAAAAVCDIIGVDAERVAEALAKVSIKGRFETLSLGGVDYIIDYAHNGKSLRAVLEVLRLYKPERLICLFGSVGGRTQMRRAELGAVASELADLSILTADNPDCEPVESIIADIAAEYKDKESYVAINDRKKAIEYAVSIAKRGDIVLLAGKGHEDYQLIAGLRYPFCEREIIINAARVYSEK